MSFLITALPMQIFAPMFALSPVELKKRGAALRVADKKPGFPCRVSLADAEIGETVLLANYEHQPANTPFRSTHAVYVRAAAIQAHCEVNQVPDLLRLRLLSVRGFDQGDMLVAADVVEGREVESVIERMLADPIVSYLHLHYAKPGCYAARVERT